MNEDETERRIGRPEHRSAVKIAGAFAFFSALWIYLSDWLLALLVADPCRLTRFQNMKGWCFVLASTVLLYFLVHREIAAWNYAAGLLVERNRHEKEVDRLNRLYAVLNQVNRSLRTAAPEKFFGDVCQAITTMGGFRLAWIGRLDPSSLRVESVATAGEAVDYARGLVVFADPGPEGSSPTGTAIRELRTYVCNDFHSDPCMTPWREGAVPFGLHSSAAFVIRQAGKAWGALSVYSEEPDFFQEREIALLEAIAADIAFGMESFETERQRREAEAAIRRERDFSGAVLNSLPGVLYLHDENRRFLRWNENFERVTGYTSTEIADMSPLDFFSGTDKASLDARIQEAFAQGAYEAEADFFSKDGTRTPYYFTGLSTQIDGRSCLVGVGIDISGRRQVEMELRESEMHFRATFEQAAVGMAHVGLDGRWLRVNDKLCAIVGYTSDELLRLTIQDITHPDDLEASLAYARQVMEDKIRTYSIEKRCIHKTGSTVWVNLTVALFRDTDEQPHYFIAVVEDITERRREQRQLREQAAQLDMAMVVVRDTDGRIVRWNHGTERFYGYTAEEALGQTAHELLQTQFSQPLPEIEAQAFHSGQWEGELTQTTRDGRRVTVVSLWLAYRDPAGGPDLIIEVNNDITAMKKAEKEIQQLNLSLENRVADRTAKLQSANEDLEAFSYSVSHDLRAPLRAISGFAQILARRHRGDLNEEGRRYMDNVVLASERMGKLIDDLLAYSRLGRRAVSLRPMELSEVFSRVTEDQAARIADIGATNIVYPHRLPAVLGDPTLLQQVFSNLIGNALIYRRPGATPHIEVSCQTEGDDIIISVADNGIGIEEAYREKIFNVFQRLHGEDEYPGTGIGLAIVKKSVELLSGRVWVESKIGEGSTFFVQLVKA